MTRQEQIEKAVSEVVEERQTAVGRKKYGGWYFANWFKEGVKWADAHPDTRALWHDASEEPEESVDILCDDLDGGFRLINWVAYTSWADYCFINGVTRWAYVRDLLPEGGDR